MNQYYNNKCGKPQFEPITPNQDILRLLGDWKDWRAACEMQQKLIPPAEFKALSVEQRRWMGKRGLRVE